MHQTQVSVGTYSNVHVICNCAVLYCDRYIICIEKIGVLCVLLMSGMPKDTSILKVHITYTHVHIIHVHVHTYIYNVHTNLE